MVESYEADIAISFSSTINFDIAPLHILSSISSILCSLTYDSLDSHILHSQCPIITALNPSHLTTLVRPLSVGMLLPTHYVHILRKTILFLALLNIYMYVKYKRRKPGLCLS